MFVHDVHDAHEVPRGVTNSLTAASYIVSNERIEQGMCRFLEDTSPDEVTLTSVSILQIH
jgi:hypothetical protein